MFVFLLAALVGLVVADEHCYGHSSCQGYGRLHCHSYEYAICKSGDGCKCIRKCHNDRECNSDRTYDLSGHHCSHDTHYCLRDICHCGSDHLATSDGTCPNNHTAECHNVICAFSTHLACVRGICTCRSDAENGGCLSNSDCHTLQGCDKTNLHCIDGKCQCLQLSTTPKPACTTQSDCAIPNCMASDVHCLDGNCKCLTQTTTVVNATIMTTLPTTTGIGLPACRHPTECSMPKTCKDRKNLHCIDGYCICL